MKENAFIVKRKVHIVNLNKNVYNSVNTNY